MRLEPARLGPLHVLADAMYARRVHGVVSQGLVFQEVLDVSLVEGVLDHLRQPRAHVGLLAIADGVDQQFAQRPTLEMELAKHVEHLAAQRQ